MQTSFKVEEWDVSILWSLRGHPIYYEHGDGSYVSYGGLVLKGCDSHHYGNQSRGYLMGEEHYEHPLCPGLQPGPPSQTPGGLGQRYWSVSEVTWPPKSGVSGWGSLEPSVRVSRDVPPLVGYSHVKNTPVGYHFFVLSHSLWVIFMKFSYLATPFGSFFSCDQAALQMVFSVCLSVCPSVCLSVCPSVRLSVCHTFLTMFPSSYHHEIFRSYYQWPK